jgi:ribosome biogenesis protein MAK21
MSCAFELLCAKPEEEENLLTLLANKVVLIRVIFQGDLDRKIASKATHLLSQLLLQHPAMKLVIITEVERLLLRPNIGDRARYYSITFLNQIVLNKSADTGIANKLIQIYFTIFASLVKTLKNETAPLKSNKKNPRKEASAGALNDIDSLNFKMMAALLTGVNRAYPFAELESKVFETHLDTLFKISHLSSFNTSIQALTLIFQVQSEKSNLSSRFFRTLYDSLLDRRLFDTSKHAMYLNLLYRSLKADTSIVRIKSFIKRLVQACSVSEIPLICGSLFLISELCSQKPELWTLMAQAEDNEDEHFLDADKDMDRDCGTSESLQKAYDGRKRDPLFTNSDNSSLWELNVLTNHFHPTVSLYAKTILKGVALTVPKDATNYDPLLNHTLSRFLERFVYKAPKKIKSIHHGSSLMQPRGFSNQLVSGGKRKSNVVLDDEGTITAMDDGPVNTIQWKNEEQVPADEVQIVINLDILLQILCRQEKMYQ